MGKVCSQCQSPREQGLTLRFSVFTNLRLWFIHLRDIFQDQHAVVFTWSLVPQPACPFPPARMWSLMYLSHIYGTLVAYSHLLISGTRWPHSAGTLWPVLSSRLHDSLMTLTTKCLLGQESTNPLHNSAEQATWLHSCCQQLTSPSTLVG